MKLITSYLFFLCCIACFSSCAQGNRIQQQVVIAPSAVSNDSFQLAKFIPGVYNFMEVDILNNLYLVTAGNQLKKMNEQGDSMGVFNDVKKYGNPSLVDVNNPLRTLLYYKNFATVVMLDRLLSQRNSINFRKQNIFSVKAVANAYDNNIWVFDEQDMSLKKINEDGKILQQSTDWRLLMPEVPSPQIIIDANNFVYLYDPAKGFYIFDYYGTYKNSLPFLNWSSISISNGMLAGFSGNKFFSYQLQSLNLRTYTLPPFFNGYSVIKAMNGKIYLLKKDGIYIYTVL